MFKSEYSDVGTVKQSAEEQAYTDFMDECEGTHSVHDIYNYIFLQAEGSHVPLYLCVLFTFTFVYLLGPNYHLLMCSRHFTKGRGDREPILLV